ncbi:MAG: hypothetical protein K0Q71_3727 [Thermomicrobiales bacterium]|nr:hypothetical protein [Thermomicrobiales bacterium]
MPNFAIVIGIDSYANPAWNLDAAVPDALAFLEWAHGAGGVPADATHTRLLLSTNRTDVTTFPFVAATNENIVKTIIEFQDGAGKDGDRLYFYYAGHGVSNPGTARGGPPEPVIIPADVKDMRVNAGLLIPFSAIITALSGSLPAEHLFFIDACRDFALEEFTSTISPASIRWQPPLVEGGQRAAQFVLYATSPGQRAYETGRGAFGKALVAGLKGEGAAKTWLQPPPRYDVGFNKLAQFVRGRVEAEIRRMAGGNAERYIQVPQIEILGATRGTDPVLQSIDPGQVGLISIGVRITPREAREKGRVRAIQHGPGGREVEFADEPPPLALPARLTLGPADYIVVATADDFGELRQVCVAYEEQILDFPMEQAVAGAVAAPGPTPSRPPSEAVGPEARGEATFGLGELSFAIDETVVGAAPALGALDISTVDPTVAVVVRDSQLQIVPGGTGRGSMRVESLPPGIYRVQPVVPDGELAEQVVEVRAGETTSVPIVFTSTPLNLGAAQTQMLGDLGITVHAEGPIAPSESLSPIADARLASLLGFAAFAAHWPGDAFHRLRTFGVTPLTDLEPGAAGLLVLVGAAGESPARALTPQEFVAAGRYTVLTFAEDLVAEGELAPLSGFAAAAQTRMSIPVGSVDLTLRLPELAPTHYAAVGLPDHVTVLVLVAEDGGGFDVQQYIIPLQRPGQAENSFLLADPANIRRLEQAQRYFASGQEFPLNYDLASIYGEWLDPLLGSMAGYTLIRRGMAADYASEVQTDDGQPLRGGSPLRTMLGAYDALPDSHVLAGLAEPEHRAQHYANALQRGLPLFVDGFRALYDWYREQGGELPAPLAEAGLGLLPGTIWTAWTMLRPTLLVRGGRLAETPPGWEISDATREAIERTCRAVGRIEPTGPSAVQFFGTAFLVAPDVLLTASFIAESFAALDANGTWAFQPGMGARVDLGEEFGGEEPIEIEITGVIGVDNEHQVALLRAAPQTRQGAPLPTALTIAAHAPEPLERRDIYVVGYPGFDARMNPTLAEQIFKSTFNVKRVMPGEIVHLAEDGVLHHDAFTQGGTAGGCLVDLETNLVLGMHFGGRYIENSAYKDNMAVPLWPLRGTPLLKDAGVRFG